MIGDFHDWLVNVAGVDPARSLSPSLRRAGYTFACFSPFHVASGYTPHVSFPFLETCRVQLVPQEEITHE